MNTQYSGNEKLIFEGIPTEYTIRDFWAWNYSNLLNNTLRGFFSEFIVATALGADVSGVNDDWTEYDLLLKWEPEVRVEVKSSAYIQAWETNKPSNISFSIKSAYDWDPVTGYGNVQERHSDVYVFCLYTEMDRTKADPLKLDCWEFYVLSTKLLNERCPNQKTLTLNSLINLEPIKTDYSGLLAAVKQSVTHLQRL
ncbi:MAG: hypothetical protein GX684_03285 [Ruminococcaceae bacterium]|nr:hypothetical protein [Oscillospiraceae bacterium]